jgi:curved DNA-binding protein CbpA
MKDYYKILELRFGAPSSEIKMAFRRLALKFHPDKNPGNAYAARQFLEISEAYEVLSSEQKRMLYHAQYNDFLNGRYISKLPEDSLKDRYRRNPTYVPKQPVAPASEVEMEFAGFRIGFFILLIVMIVYLLIQSRKEIRERELKREAAKQELIEKQTRQQQPDTLSNDEFLKIIYNEFMTSGDSVLIKSNLDSLKKVYDSLIQVSKK